MQARRINPQNLRRLCWKRGFSITDLAERIGRNRVSVHRAAKRPKRFPETYRLMAAELFPEPNGTTN